jgi:hypothetical protein
MAMRYMLKRKDNITSWMAIGVFAGMCTLWVQSWLEWAYRQTYITVEFYLFAGFLAALPRLDRAIRKRRKMERAKRAWLEQQLTTGHSKIG